MADCKLRYEWNGVADCWKVHFRTLPHWHSCQRLNANGARMQCEADGTCVHVAPLRKRQGGQGQRCCISSTLLCRALAEPVGLI
jgi:hypothetical protein